MKACPTADFRFSARARIPLLANDQGTTLVIRWEINSLASLFRGEKVKGSKRSPIAIGLPLAGTTDKKQEQICPFAVTDGIITASLSLSLRPRPRSGATE